MDLHDLVRALLRYETLDARQWVIDASRTRLRWSDLPAPADLDPLEKAVAAGVVELLSSRAGEPPPAWTSDVQAAPRTVFLVRAADSMPRLRRVCEEEGPEPLRRRGILAPPHFLTFA